MDKIGTAFEADYVATGLGKHMAIPIIRERWVPTLTEGQARTMLEECMRVLFYRDCRTINRVSPMDVLARRHCPRVVGAMVISSCRRLVCRRRSRSRV